jgi:hypothetical protein
VVDELDCDPPLPPLLLLVLDCPPLLWPEVADELPALPPALDEDEVGLSLEQATHTSESASATMLAQLRYIMSISPW